MSLGSLNLAFSPCQKSRAHTCEDIFLHSFNFVSEQVNCYEHVVGVKCLLFGVKCLLESDSTIFLTYFYPLRFQQTITASYANIDLQSLRGQGEGSLRVVSIRFGWFQLDEDFIQINFGATGMDLPIQKFQVSPRYGCRFHCENAPPVSKTSASPFGFFKI